jgi:hypothetical protein
MHALGKIILVRLGRGLAHPRLWGVLLHPLTRYVLAWLLALTVATGALSTAWTSFDVADRPDGNKGHTHIDFGGQWLLARIVVEGRGHHLYDRTTQREVLARAYPRENEAPDQQGHDADSLMDTFMGRDDLLAAQTVGTFLLPLANSDGLGNVLGLCVAQHFWQPEPAYPGVAALTLLAARDEPGILFLTAAACQTPAPDRLAHVRARQVGGPLYPPVHALLFSPLGLLAPGRAYRAWQIAGLLLGLLAGWGVRQLSEGRIWWPVATVLVILFPGFGSALSLGQNSPLSLAILVWGWLLIARGRPGWGGVVWGLLAYKPVWAAAFLLVPVWTRRWRVCSAMLATGTALFAATLPVVGWQGWLDWLHVGREAARLFHTDENWIFLSRDLLTIPRRWLLDFSVPATERPDRVIALFLGTCSVVTVLEITTRLAGLRPRQGQVLAGPPIACLFLAAWLCCFHFMYYDVLLAALPVFLLLTEPRSYLRPHVVVLAAVAHEQMDGADVRYYRPGLAVGYPSSEAPLRTRPNQMWVLNSMVLSLLALLLAIEHLFPRLGIALSIKAARLPSWPIVQPIQFSTDLVGPPWDTFCLEFLWVWCGLLWLRTKSSARDSS